LLFLYFNVGALGHGEVICYFFTLTYFLD